MACNCAHDGSSQKCLSFFNEKDNFILIFHKYVESFHISFVKSFHKIRISRKTLSKCLEEMNRLTVQPTLNEGL